MCFAGFFVAKVSGIKLLGGNYNANNYAREAGQFTAAKGLNFPFFIANQVQPNLGGGTFRNWPLL